MLNRIFLGVAILLTAFSASASADDLPVHWTCSTASAPFANMPDLTATGGSAHPGGVIITVNPDQKFQKIDGWGGCFNERGWRAMQMLPPEQRSKVMAAMFDPKDGLKLNLCRTPIGASDFAIDLYSYDETPGDFTMDHFSIDRDRQMLIPYIKAALALEPDLKIWGVPWSPPSWMKDSGKLAGGKIKTDAPTLDALALYFVKYVQAYRAEGLPLFMVMPQNEPCYSNKYTSCIWTGAQIGLFVRDHLGPMFQKTNLNCQIYLGTFPRSDPGKLDYNYWLAPSMNDPVTRSFVTGIGCQWGGQDVMRDARDKNPGIKLMQTEGSCGKTNSNDWAFAKDRFGDMVKYFDCGAESFMIWNLVLDETGLSTAGWAQCSPIVVNQKTGAVVFTPYFFMYKHFSSFVPSGAVRIAADITGFAKGKAPRCLAFLNPDGRTVLVAENQIDRDMPITLKLSGRTFTATLAAESFNTFYVDGAAPGN